MVLIEGVSSKCSRTVNILTPTMMRHPHHLAYRSEAVLRHEAPESGACAPEGSQPLGPDGGPYLHRARARHYVLERVRGAGHASDPNYWYLHCLVNLVHASDAHWPYRRSGE